MTRHMLTDLLKTLDCEVHSFCDPSEILSDLEETRRMQHADIVITDFQMPVMSGLELTVKLIGSGFNSQNIAIISGYWTEDSFSHAESLGVTTFQKPLSMSALSAWIEGRRGVAGWQLKGIISINQGKKFFPDEEGCSRNINGDQRVKTPPCDLQSLFHPQS